MTSASKLFHSRRICFGARDNAVDDTQPDSSQAEGNSYRRTTTDRRHHHRNNRLDLGGCNPPPRRFNRHHHSEHELVNLEHGSIINSEDFRSIRRWGATENDRLPGVVLLARERLVERLRGVRISENSTIHQSSSFIETDNNQLEESVSESRQTGLLTKVFNVEENSERSRECSICLEGFENGDKLINLACMHTFHSCCLLPWVELCGACPNCRKHIDVTSNYFYLV